MAATPNNEELIARYLLGELPEEQQVGIENRAFEDKDYLATITVVENDLIDEYVRDEMSASQRRNFETRFLASAERRKRVEFARALATVAAEAAVTEKASRTVVPAAPVSWRDSLEAFFRGLNPVAKFAVAAAMLLILAGGAWLLIETLRLRNQLNQLQAEKQTRQNQEQSLEQQVEAERKRNAELIARLNQEKQQREQTDESLRQLSEVGDTKNTASPRSIIASLTLLPGISRGASEKPNLALAGDVRVVRLQLGIDPDEQYKNFAVEVRTGGGRQVWNRENLRITSRGGARAIGLTLPATILKPGEYELRLMGVAEGGGREDLGFYYFDVTKR